MRPPDRESPGGEPGLGYCGERTEATNLKKDSSTRLPFRTPWLRIVCRSLAIKAQPCDLSRSLAVSALVAEIREALREIDARDGAR